MPTSVAELTPLLSHTKKNKKTKRILAFDFARGLAILLMIVIHVLTFYGSPEVQQGHFAKTIDLLLSWPSASVFVFLMGVLVAYSNSNNLSKGLQRAGLLFLLGYLLNFLRETIPTWLSLEMGLVTYEQLGEYTPLNGLLVVDILQFAAIAFSICMLLKHFFNSPFVWLSVAVVIMFISPFFWDIKSGVPFIDHILKLLWGNVSQGAIFPVFPWLAYPIMGMAFGYWFKHSKDQRVTFNQTLLAGFTLILVGWLLTLTNVEYHTAEHLRHGPGMIIIITGFVFLWLWGCQFIINHCKRNVFFELMYFWSKHVTAMYFIHWLYVGWGLMIFGSEQLNLTSVLIWMTLVAILSDFSLRVWLRFVSKRL